jgi:hypothetical protein
MAGFATGCSRPWWGPVGWHAGWGGRWRPGWERGWGGLDAGRHINHINFNNFNLYHRWKHPVVTAPRHAVAVAPRHPIPVSPHRELNNLVAGHDGHVDRREGNGWAMHSGEGWHRIEPAPLPPAPRPPLADTARRLDREWAARQNGQARYNAFRAPGHPAAVGPRPGVVGPAGFHGDPGGFRGPPAIHGGAVAHGGAGAHGGVHRHR